MKRKLLIALSTVLMCLVGIEGTHAQSMRVVSFEKLEGDITANMQENKRISPQDGKPAALIKVITTEKDFSFSGGTYSLVDVVQKPGEVWVYVPSRAQRISVAHDRYGRLNDYYFPMPLEPACTYELVLDPGQGKYATIQTSVPHSTVYLDGDSIGVSPIKMAYILYGHHKLTANKERNDGSLNIAVINDGDQGLLTYEIPMVDQSLHYGNVVVTAEPGVEIYMDGKMLDRGKWTGELYEGSYTIETRDANSDPAITHFTVVPQQTINVAANAPIPHKGYLSLYTRPATPSIEIDGHPATLTDRIELPVGRHSIVLSHKGYYDTPSLEYDIRHNITLQDTVNLQHLQYVTADGFYFGAAATIGSFSGVTGILGGRYSNIDLQLSYMFGLTTSKDVHYYNKSTGRYLGTSNYKLNVLSAKIGYQIAFSPTFGLTPQVGIAAHQLKGSSKSGSVPDKDTSAACATIGARFVYAPLQHLSVFAAPEYDIAVSKGQQYAEIADAAGFASGGFYCNIGLLVTF